jgi:hypothetical protein
MSARRTPHKVFRTALRQVALRESDYRALCLPLIIVAGDLNRNPYLSKNPSTRI